MHTLVWDIDHLPVGMIKVVQVTFTLPPDGSLIGRTICSRVSAIVAGLQQSFEVYSVSDEQCTDITGSLDPNEITVAPYGAEPPGAILECDSVLHYTIYFQNTGTDTAFKVVILDRLPEEIDLSTLRPGASSHPYELDITPTMNSAGCSAILCCPTAILMSRKATATLSMK